jgi:hypothetical protein
MADTRYLRLAEPMQGVSLKTGQWEEARSFIEATIADSFDPTGT